MARPPKERSFANMLRIAINEANEEGGTKLREVADALVTKATTGDVQAIKEIADRLDGKPQQQVDMDVDAKGDLLEFLTRIANGGRRLVDGSPDD